jgi:NTP pyrophosphatase (non-canonical NTP hydrolase)
LCAKEEIVVVLNEAYRSIVDERDRQERKWGVQRHDMTVWLTVLSEEVGELAQAILHYRELMTDQRHDAIRAEAVQVAAVAVAMIEHLDEMANAP